MTPAGADDVGAIESLVRARLPSFRAHALLSRSIKCVLLEGTLDERPVVVKWLARDVPPWRWYFDRERELLERFRASPDRACAPELIASDPADRWMVLAKVEGEALAQGRFAHGATEETVRATLDARARWARTTTPWPDARPDAATHAEMRSRLLEDPSEGLMWCTDGLTRGAALRLIDADDARRAIEALRAWPACARSHGDLLPRNVIVGAARATLVDVECAGDHPEAWDHALLWANVPAELRAAVEADFGLRDDARGAAFRACVVFALVRERKFARGGGRATTIAETLQEAVEGLRRGGASIP